jgi:hypothetical protein
MELSKNLNILIIIKNALYLWILIIKKEQVSGKIIYLDCFLIFFLKIKLYQ